MKRYSTHSRWAPYVFLAPFVIVFGVFTMYPLMRSVVLSMQQTFGPDHVVFLGGKNYTDLMADPTFWKAVKNTFVFAALSVGIQLPMSLGLAMLLNSKWLRGRAFFRLIFFSPALVGIVFVAMMFQIMLAKGNGLVNGLLNKATVLVGNGVEAVAGFVFGTDSSAYESVATQVQAFIFNPNFSWLEEYVMTALILCSLWMYIGFNMVYFLAALQGIDRDLVDAAKVDGAGPWQRFKHIVLPAIRPVAGFVVLLSLIGSLQLFELPYLILNQSAGPDYRGLTIVMYLYQNGFESGDLGYATAIGWVLAIMLVVMTLGQQMIQRRKEAL